MEEEINFSKSTEQILLKFEFQLDHLNELIQIRTNYNQSDQDFELYVETMSIGREKAFFTKQDVEAFALEIQPAKNQQQSNTNFVSKNKKSQAPQTKLTDITDKNLLTAKDKDYENRERKLQPVGQYNPSNLPQVTSTYLKNQQFLSNDIIIDTTQKQTFDKYLISDQIDLKQNILKRIEKMKEFYEKYLHENFNYKNITWWDGNDLSSQELYICGRIFSEEEGKINKDSVYIEINEEKRYKLDLTLIKDYILFNNQIVALKGIVDAAKGKIDIKEMFLNTYKQMSTHEDGRLKDPDEAFTVLVASGPFTQQDSIRYRPLDDLIVECKQILPTFLILIGPFLDERNKILQRGDIIVQGQVLDYEGLFDSLLFKLKQALPSTKIMLVPSPKDINSYYPIPQPKYYSDVAQKQLLYQDMSYHTNPCRLEIESIVDGDAQVEILQSDLMIDFMGSNVLVEGVYKQQKLRSCMEQIVQQRNIVPLYPSTNPVDLLNLTSIPLWEDYDIPHIIITPSYLNFQVELVNTTLFLNPGVLCKGTQGGTFMVMNYYSNNSLSVENKVLIEIKGI